MERFEGIHAYIGLVIHGPVYGGITVKLGIVCLVFGPRNPLVGCSKARGNLVGCIVSPTFMLGIWHEGDWLKRDLSQPIYDRVECGSPITGWFIASINEKIIPLIFMCKFTDVYMDFDG